METIKKPIALLSNRSRKHLNDIISTGDFTKLNFEHAATEYWIGNGSTGDQYRLKRYGPGWVIQVQESFMNKSGVFEYKGDIPSFHFLAYAEPNESTHKFATKEEAIHCFITTDHFIL